MSWGERFALSDRLRGRRILVIDDESIIALDLGILLSDAGATVIGPVATVAAGLACALEEPLSAALLDVRLAGETIAPVASALAERGVPMLFYSGQLETDAMLSRWPNSAFIPKPAPARSLVARLCELMEKNEAAGPPAA
jgi:DNA-binding response OmpR family regulator